MAAIASLSEIAHHGCPEEIPKQGCNLQFAALALSSR
jgi:hypothetical protein